jgi:putative transposase
MDNDEPVRFEPGQKLIFNGTLCQIESPLSLDTVLLKDVNSGTSYTAKISELMLPNESFQKISDAPSSRIDLTLISTADWEKAKQREVVIKPLSLVSCTLKQTETAGDILGLSSRQIYRLIKLYQSSGNKLNSLIIPKKSGGKGKTRLSLEIEAVIQSVVKENYLSRQQIKVSIVVEEIRRRCFHANIKAPCDNVIRKRIQQVSTKEITKKRRGANEARQYQPVIGSFPIPDYPLTILQIDHTPVDLIIVDEFHRKPIGRPYLTIAIDVFSRCITGFCLSLEPPSAVSVGLCLTHSIFDKEIWLSDRKIESSWPIWGKPSLIYVDNAKEFHSEALQRGCDTHGIKIDYRPIGACYWNYDAISSPTTWNYLFKCRRTRRLYI